MHSQVLNSKHGSNSALLAPANVVQRAAVQPAAAPTRAQDGLHSPGQPLDAATRAYMEPRFGHDFSQVRVHTDRAAAESAQAVGALAYTVGHDLVFQPGQYNAQSSAGKQLLAHELTHVVQQGDSQSLQTKSLGQAGDRHEQEADRAAELVSGGSAVAIQAAGSVPGVQLQRVSTNGVARSEVQAALEEFLTKAKGDNDEHHSLRVTPAIRTLLQRLVDLPDPNYAGPGGDPQRGIRGGSLNGWLDGGILPGDPATFARQVMRYLPDPCSPQALTMLGKAPAKDATPGTTDRLKTLVEDSAPADKSPEAKQLDSERQPSSSERFDQFVQDQQRQSGVTDHRYGPYSVDVLRLGRIAEGLPGAFRGPKPKKAQPAELSEDVLSAIRKVNSNALTPAGANADEYADARDVAGELARELDSAHQAGRDQVILHLGANYSNVRDPGPIFAAIRQIAEQMRAALPHHAPGVRSVNVVFGDHLARVLPLGAASE